MIHRKRNFSLIAGSLIAMCLPGLLSAAEPQLSHNVFFTLKERTDESAKKLVDGCAKHLTDHEGVLYFSVGTRAKDFTRDVNDTEFDVALVMVFRNKEAHDKYQTHERHAKFIEENKDLWESVRVFDFSITPPPAKNDAKQQSQQAPPLPEEKSDK